MVVVMAAAFPSPSTTETFAVPASGASVVRGVGTRTALNPRRREQCADGYRGEGGITVPAGAIRERLGHRGGEEMEGGRAAGPEGGKIVSPEQAEHLEHHAARSGRREGDDSVAPETAVQRLPPDGAVAGQVGGRNDAAVRLHGARDRLCQRASLPLARAAAREPLERPGEIRLDHPEAGAGQTAVGSEKDAAEPRIGGEEPDAPLDLTPEMG